MLIPSTIRTVAIFILSLAAVLVPDVSSSQTLRIIDAHAHTNFESLESGRPKRQDFLQGLKAAGIVASIIMESRRPTETTHLRQPGIFYCAGVDVPVDVLRIEKGLQSRQYRCLKIYLGYVRRYASDPAYEPAYMLAKKYGVPVVFHTGDTDSSTGKLKYADPLTIDEVAVDHPDITLVIAHCGNPWIESAAEVAYKNPNVMIECSAMLSGDLKIHDPQEVEKYMVDPIRWVFGYVDDPKKFMFASDWPVTDMASYVEAYKRAIPQKYWQAVFHDNAIRIFRLKSEVE
jgi:uncharacterized protein